MDDYMHDHQLRQNVPPPKILFTELSGCLGMHSCPNLKLKHRKQGNEGHFVSVYILRHNDTKAEIHCCNIFHMSSLNKTITIN